MYARVGADTWRMLHNEYVLFLYRELLSYFYRRYRYGGGPMCAAVLSYCNQCTDAWRMLQEKRRIEGDTFQRIERSEKERGGQRIGDYRLPPIGKTAISASWMRQWQKFILCAGECEHVVFVGLKELFFSCTRAN